MTAVLTPMDEVQTEVPQQSANRDAVKIEFTGWMPIYDLFSYCGGHPQFEHVAKPPAGYQFVRERKVVTPFIDIPPRPTGWLLAWHTFQNLVASLPSRLWNLLCAPFQPPYRLIRTLVQFGPIRCLRTLLDAFHLYSTLRRGGARMLPAMKFVRSRHYSSQLMLPPRPNLLFLTSVPFTYGQHPWVVEIEDATSLFYPFINNGNTSRLRLEESDYYPIVKTLLESDNCRGIITHMRCTSEAVPRMFDSEIIRQKVAHIPMGIELPSAWQTHDEDYHVDLLFSNSWHQNTLSFFLRGGLEVLEAFDILYDRYPQVRLTLRTKLPELGERHRRIIEKCHVRVIERYLPNDEMQELRRSAHIFLLPSARVHIVSLLKSMASGNVVVTSDGWGFAEYVDHGQNGMIVPGRAHKVTWSDPRTGMLREDYEPMYRTDWEIVDRLVMTLSILVEDRAMRRRLGTRARQDIAAKFNLKNWNKGLKEVLDRATNR